MSNIRDVRQNLCDPDKQPSVVLNTGNLLTVNRMLFFLFAALMALVIMLGFLLFPANSLMTSLEMRQRTAELNSGGQNPALTAEINALKGQLTGLVSASIESKLRSLEENIRADNVTAVDLGTIQDIKNSLNILRASALSSENAATSQKTELAGHTALMNNGQLLSEFSQLKYLIYLSIASCGVMIAAVGGIWLQNHRNRIGQQKQTGLLGKSGKN